MSRVPGWAGIGRERESILVREICREREKEREREREEMRDWRETKKGDILVRVTLKHITLFFPTCYNKLFF